VSERLQKFLARAGVASRRHAEGLITAGRVSVNNQRVTELGTKVEPKDLVTVDGKLVTVPEHTSWYLIHKPPGVVTTLSDPEGRPTVAGLLEGVEQRVFPVGRLDWDAEGALLLTNDGGAAHRLLHPSFEVPRTYLVKVKGSPTDETLDRLREGVRLEDGPARALRAERFEATERNTWVLLQVSEGRPHLVKRLCAAVGHPVVRLFRPAQAGISVAGLQPGELRSLTADEVQRVEAVAAGGAVPEPAPFLPPRRHGRAGEDDETLDAQEGSGTLVAPAGDTPTARSAAAAPEGGSRPRRGRPSGPGGFPPGGPLAERSGSRAAGAGGFPSSRGGARGRRPPDAGEGFRPRGRDTGRRRFGGETSRGATEGGFRPRGRGTAPGPFGGGTSRGAGAPEGEFRPGGGSGRFRSERSREAPEGGFRPRGRDTQRGRFGAGPSGEAGAPEGGFRPRGRDTGRGRFGGRPSRGAGASGRGFGARGRDTKPSSFAGGGTRGAGAPEGEFRPRGRDTQHGRFGGRPSRGTGASGRGFGPRGRDTDSPFGSGTSRGPRAPEGELRQRGRGTERGRFGGGPSRGAGSPERGFRPRGQATGRGRSGDEASRGAPDGGFRPRGRDTGRGKFAGGPSRGAGAPAGSFRPRGPASAGDRTSSGRGPRGSGNSRGRGRFGALPRGGGARRPRPGPRGGGGGGRGGGRP
jgi:23S rRNA pseudouridine2605 synthase